ncbi:helix-turn-helix domain-containing protein [Paenibacillus thermoaerophilus]|uniref:Helix-turn-helix domain-containing protein n=1 Tax=Paenibacillus thermoaerophilus TaxID=1215385 RepID=A0ABW2V6P5_9BACL|nr:helix-turn-helix transcriptional regulator [Paenibacillus thermoaerophilus]TMV17946.1 helix-turn-helix transcriptional regulator [Paenibacillus thermoaerophilus]
MARQQHPSGQNGNPPAESAARPAGRGEEIYRRIEQLIRSQGITQAEFARSIRVSTGNVGDWKRGKSMPGAGVLIDIAKTYQISLDWLLLGRQSDPQHLREEDGVYFFADKWQLDSRFASLSAEEQAFVREYIDFCLERRRKSSQEPRREPAGSDGNS